jgi:hypothetical protein
LRGTCPGSSSKVYCWYKRASAILASCEGIEATRGVGEGGTHTHSVVVSGGQC